MIRCSQDANEMVRLAVEAVMTGDSELAMKVIAMDDGVDMGERRIVQETTNAIMLESPVAADLRFLVGTFNVASEIEKVGDDAVKMSRRVTRGKLVFPGELKLSFQQIGEQARRVFNAAIRLYAEYDPVLAQEIVAEDAVIDAEYGEAYRRCEELLRAGPEDTDSLMRTIDSFRSLEHVADRAVAMANRLAMIYEPMDSRTSSES